ncbi:D-alanyl-D-alanine carboxypeptidase/D-alanyl-D-alanine-endopeptidase [Meridianimarinicoccus sp. MJW13]|uniref:D-alanyl-D-alanine carboxypeptidase/D-alanyl-D-alanine endopeptidase n=1 Tax=Meridianimarinicoccus sp. MJW13 TaxID=2720031 RepID=UPI00186673CA|nr:D-alanyl-D-alanine carboxypeptidase/D-alanyl-D-alanine-endopeptidase [Fluviibacterium sp. MJW13]
MSRNILLKRRAVLTGIAGLAAQGALANVPVSPIPTPRPSAPPPRDLAALTRALIADVGLSGEVACVMADAQTGQPLVVIQPDLLLPPASVTKAVTAAYAYDTLGPGYRFATRVLGTGPMRDGVLHGDLVLAGGGDPGLDTVGLAQLAADLKAIGLHEVKGRLLIWSAALPLIPEIAPDQPDHLGYNPSVSGLNLNYNRVHFEWRQQGADYQVTMDARVGTLRPRTGHARVQLAARSLPVYAHRTDADTGYEHWSVARPALGTGGARWLPVRDSGLYAGDVFRTLLRAEGLVLPAAKRITLLPEGQTLASRISAPLYDIARGMLKYSTNLTAEVLGLEASAHLNGAPLSDLPSSGAAMTNWAKAHLGMTQSQFVDHSGLGDGSRTTTRDLCSALLLQGREGALKSSLKNIALRQDDGTATPLSLSAKTGTLNFVSALAGHIAPRAGPGMIFAILTADMARRAAIAPDDRENPAGSQSWTRRSRRMQYNLVRLWSGVPLA